MRYYRRDCERAVLHAIAVNILLHAELSRTVTGDLPIACIAALLSAFAGLLFAASVALFAGATPGTAALAFYTVANLVFWALVLATWQRENAPRRTPRLPRANR